VGPKASLDGCGMCQLHRDLISGPSSSLRVAIPAHNKNNHRYNNGDDYNDDDDDDDDDNNNNNNNNNNNSELCWPDGMKWGIRRRIGDYDGEKEVEEKTGRRK